MGGDPHAYDEWLDMSEPRSWRDGIKRYGSLADGHHHVLTKQGFVNVQPPYRAFDMLIVTGVCRIDGHEPWDARGGRELVAFVSDDCTEWYFGHGGLTRLRERGPVVHAMRMS